MAAHTSFKDRTLIAVVGDEVRTLHLSSIRPLSFFMTGLNHWPVTRGRRPHQRAPEEEFPRRRF